MRVAVFSDVHSNVYALEAMLEDAKDRRIDAYWCLGDLVGRGFKPIETANLLQMLYEGQSPQHQRCWLRGNHEFMIEYPSGFIRIDGHEVSLGSDPHAAQWAKYNGDLLQNRPDLSKWLYSLPTHAQPFPHVYLAHAAYWFNDDGQLDEDFAYRMYLYNDAVTDSVVLDMLCRMQEHGNITSGLVLGGHTHCSGVWVFRNDGAPTTSRDANPHRPEGWHFKVDTDLVYINVGSIGFPRITDTCSTYVVLQSDNDFKSVDAEFVTIDYNTDEIRFPKDYPELYRRQMTSCPT